MNRVLLLAAGLLLLAASPVLAEAHAERLLIVIGSKHGLSGEWPLAYAQRDAARFARVMVELGHVAPEHVVELFDPSAQDILAELRAVAGRARSADVTLFVFYSGHGSDTALHVQGQALALSVLRQELERVPARLKLLVVDACRGAVARKGFGTTEPFALSLTQPAQHRGLIVLSAAGTGEEALESYELRSGVFTHHLLSALRGAADQDADGRVSLYEAYDYAYSNTLKTSAQANNRGQHATLDLALEGSGPLVLTRLAPAKSVLTLPGASDYHYVVFERGSDTAVAEVNTTRTRLTQLALPAGQFVVYRNSAAGTAAAEVTLPFGGTKVLETSDFKATSASAFASKGMYRRHPHALSFSLGAATNLAHRAGPQASLGYEWSSGSWASTLTLGATGYELRTVLAGSRQSIDLSYGMEYRVPLGSITVGAGAGAAVGWIRQTLRERPGRLAPDVDNALSLGAFATVRLILPVDSVFGWQIAARASQHFYRQEEIGSAGARILGMTAFGILSGAQVSF